MVLICCCDTDIYDRKTIIQVFTTNSVKIRLAKWPPTSKQSKIQITDREAHHHSGLPSVGAQKSPLITCRESSFTIQPNKVQINA